MESKGITGENMGKAGDKRGEIYGQRGTGMTNYLERLAGESTREQKGNKKLGTGKRL